MYNNYLLLNNSILTIITRVAADTASSYGYFFFIGEFSYMGKNIAICGRLARYRNFIIGVVGIGTEVVTARGETTDEPHS